MNSDEPDPWEPVRQAYLEGGWPAAVDVTRRLAIASLRDSLERYRQIHHYHDQMIADLHTLTAAPTIVEPNPIESIDLQAWFSGSRDVIQTRWDGFR